MLNVNRKQRETESVDAYLKFTTADEKLLVVGASTILPGKVDADYGRDPEHGHQNAVICRHEVLHRHVDRIGVPSAKYRTYG